MCDELLTKRLHLRQWRDEDRPLFAAINSDPCVMQHFPRLFSRKESDSFIDDNIERLANTSWGAWAVETIENQEFIGFVGFSHPASWHPCAGEIDIGWRLSHHHWGKGYATEAAKHALSIGFTKSYFTDVVSFTSACNVRSTSVMKKIGMLEDPTGFQHPKMKKDNPLRRHLLFRLSREDWQARHSP